MTFPRLARLHAEKDREDRRIVQSFAGRVPRLIGIVNSPEPDDAALWRQVEQALAAGLPALMLRERRGSDDALRPLAIRMRDMTAEAGALFLMNRRLELAIECGADGVHSGQYGTDPKTLRAALGEERLVGYSAHGKAEAMAALAKGADYVTFSPIFDTPSKRGLLAPTGLGPLHGLCAEAAGAVIALGGIEEGNLAEVLEAGAHGAAMIRGVFGAADDAGAAVKRCLEIISRHSGQESAAPVSPPA